LSESDPLPRVTRFRVAILVSGSGTTWKPDLAGERGSFPKRLSRWLISNRSDAGALPRAASHGITTVIGLQSVCPEESFRRKFSSLLLENQIDIVCLAGYLKRVGLHCATVQGRILNIHPALLPNYAVPYVWTFFHEAVLKAGDKEIGVFRALVDDQYDHGRYWLRCAFPFPDDT